jgi:chemotaxis protein methyltransferase CheR
MEIGIVDTRAIVKVIKDTYDYDFSDYALTSFKRRLEKVMVDNNFKNIDNFVSKLKEDKAFYQVFLKDISIESTEMFRDPSLWRWLRDEFFAVNVSELSRIRIWIPEIVSGDELYSLAILLKESDILDKVKIFATSVSQKNIDFVKSGLFNIKKLDVSIENYKRFQGSRDLMDYITTRNNNYYRDIKLVDNVEFLKQGTIFETLNKDFRLVLYRNYLIYYNPNLQTKIVKNIHDSMGSNACLAIGFKETLEGSANEKDFVLANEHENVYRKKS